MKTIQLHGGAARGRVAIVDDEDFLLVSQYYWRLWEWLPSRGRTKGPYAITKIRRDGKRLQLGMHRLITGFAMTDHIDHDGLNNRRSNLRPATKAQNSRNGRPVIGSTSRFKGVNWHRGCGKWQVLIQVDGRTQYLGLFTSETEAADAYDRAAFAAWGEYAYLNRATP